MQQGCRYRHEMPDDETLREIGFREVPSWYKRERQYVRQSQLRTAMKARMRAAPDSSDSDTEERSPQNPAKQVRKPSIIALPVQDRPIVAAPTVPKTRVTTAAVAVRPESIKRSIRRQQEDLLDLDIPEHGLASSIHAMKPLQARARPDATTEPRSGKTLMPISPSLSLHGNYSTSSLDLDACSDGGETRSHSSIEHAKRLVPAPPPSPSSEPDKVATAPPSTGVEEIVHYFPRATSTSNHSLITVHSLTLSSVMSPSGDDARTFKIHQLEVELKRLRNDRASPSKPRSRQMNDPVSDVETAPGLGAPANSLRKSKWATKDNGGSSRPVRSSASGAADQGVRYSQPPAPPKATPKLLKKQARVVSPAHSEEDDMVTTASRAGRSHGALALQLGLCALSPTSSAGEKPDSKTRKPVSKKRAAWK